MHGRDPISDAGLAQSPKTVGAGASTPPYALGHSDHELRRLATQARLVNPITQRFLTEAGIERGMRVLDIGSGAGDVAILAADLVGSSGEVIGTDRAGIAIDTARDNVQKAALTNVSFRECDPTEVMFERPFDAIIGRYVLLFFPDPADALRKLVRHVKPQGLVVFHELDMAGARSFPPVSTYDQCCRWISQAALGSGADPNAGIRLHSTFEAAGLPAPALRLQSVVGVGSGRIDVANLVVDAVRTLLPRIERLGIATSLEVDIDNLTDRIMVESRTGNTLIGRSEVGAWSRARA